MNYLTGSDFKYSCDLLIKQPLKVLHVILHFNQLAMLQLNRYMDISELSPSNSASHRVYRFRPELGCTVLGTEFRGLIAEKVRLIRPVLYHLTACWKKRMI